MRFQGALVKEQGLTFAIVIVKSHVIQHTAEAMSTQQAFSPVFPGVPIVLMAQDSSGVPTYYGRRDIVGFLSNISMEAVPWKEYSFNRIDSDCVRVESYGRSHEPRLQPRQSARKPDQRGNSHGRFWLSRAGIAQSMSASGTSK